MKKVQSCHVSQCKLQRQIKIINQQKIKEVKDWIRSSQTEKHDCGVMATMYSKCIK